MLIANLYEKLLYQFCVKTFHRNPYQPYSNIARQKMQLAGISIPVGRQLLRKTEDVTKTGMGNGEWGMGNG